MIDSRYACMIFFYTGIPDHIVSDKPGKFMIDWGLNQGGATLVNTENDMLSQLELQRSGGSEYPLQGMSQDSD